MTQNHLKSPEIKAYCDSSGNAKVVEHPKNTQDGSYQGSYQGVWRCCQRYPYDFDTHVDEREHNRQWTQDETIERWLAKCDDEEFLRNAYRAVYDDMQKAARKRAFEHFPIEAQYALRALVERALRLAYCCTLDGEKAPAIVSTHQRRLCDAFVGAIGTHILLRPKPPAPLKPGPKLSAATRKRTKRPT